MRDGELRYYGSADATSWFLVLLASLGDEALTRELEDSWRAAGAWLQEALERGGGLVWHAGGSAAGLIHQGWRDAMADGAHGGGIAREDGTLATPPLADADTQAVAYVALRALAALSGERRHEEQADKLAARIEAEFDPETMALEGGNHRVRGAGSQLGWLLWAGVLSSPARARTAARLSAPDVMTPFGLRTLSQRHPAFRPDGYHRGSIWPFDSWLGWAGLRAAGWESEAERVRRGVLSAVQRLGRAPELYAVGEDGPEPVPIANRVQAWTIGACWALEAGWDGRAPPLFCFPHRGNGASEP